MPTKKANAEPADQANAESAQHANIEPAEQANTEPAGRTERTSFDGLGRRSYEQNDQVNPPRRQAPDVETAPYSRPYGSPDDLRPSPEDLREQKNPREHDPLQDTDDARKQNDDARDPATADATDKLGRG